MDGINTVANLMALSARTAPKAVGKDYVVIEILAGKEIQRLGEGMIAYGDESGKKHFDRDGENVLHSQSVVLVGLKDAETTGLNCAACGEEVCPEINTIDGEFSGPQCAIRVLDLGIALGSAVKMASLMNVDNRIMYRIGVVARKIGLIDADLVMGIPLSATGKSPYYDRAP